jgi:ubiquinone/menaquinone biosynthesis C-methylase UbiE
VVLDSGSGFNPEIHLLPEVCARMGFDVIAVDENPLGLAMPWRMGVTRVVGDIRNLPYLDKGADAWVCISTLEHMNRMDKAMTVREGYRVLKPGGLAVITTDETEPAEIMGLLEAVGFQGGPIDPVIGVMLTPRVAWAVAKKP